MNLKKITIFCVLFLLAMLYSKVAPNIRGGILIMGLMIAAIVIFRALYQLIKMSRARRFQYRELNSSGSAVDVQNDQDNGRKNVAE